MAVAAQAFCDSDARKQHNANVKKEQDELRRQLEGAKDSLKKWDEDKAHLKAAPDPSFRAKLQANVDDLEGKIQAKNADMKTPTQFFCEEARRLATANGWTWFKNKQMAGASTVIQYFYKPMVYNGQNLILVAHIHGDYVGTGNFDIEATDLTKAASDKFEVWGPGINAFLAPGSAAPGHDPCGCAATGKLSTGHNSLVQYVDIATQGLPTQRNLNSNRVPAHLQYEDRYNNYDAQQAMMAPVDIGYNHHYQNNSLDASLVLMMVAIGILFCLCFVAVCGLTGCLCGCTVGGYFQSARQKRSSYEEVEDEEMDV